MVGSCAGSGEDHSFQCGGLGRFVEIMQSTRGEDNKFHAVFVAAVRENRWHRRRELSLFFSPTRAKTTTTSVWTALGSSPLAQDRGQCKSEVVVAEPRMDYFKSGQHLQFTTEH